MPEHDGKEGEWGNGDENENVQFLQSSPSSMSGGKERMRKEESDAGEN